MPSPHYLFKQISQIADSYASTTERKKNTFKQNEKPGMIGSQCHAKTSPFGTLEPSLVDHQVPLPKRANLPSPIILTQAHGRLVFFPRGTRMELVAMCLATCNNYQVHPTSSNYNYIDLDRNGSFDVGSGSSQDWLMKHALPRNDLFLAKRVLMVRISEGWIIQSLG